MALESGVVGAANRVRLTDLATGAPLATLGATRHATSVAFSADNSKLRFVGFHAPRSEVLWDPVAASRIELWDLAELRLIRYFEAPQPDVTCVAVSADGQLIVAGTIDGALRIWNRDDSSPAPATALGDAPAQSDGGQPRK